MKGYPRSRFEIVNQTQIQNNIETNSVGNTKALYMQLYTSNKGTENWELLTSLDGFTDAKGGMSFTKHGQAQLTVAQALRSGAYVLGKRLVSDDALLANTTVRARVVKDDETATSFVYLYAVSDENCKNFDAACKFGYEFKAPEGAVDVPLFTVTAMGRGKSLSFFRLNPEYTFSRSKLATTYMKYSFEVMEDNNNLEKILLTVNPEIIVDGISQYFNPRIKTNSNQVKVKSYDDGIYKLVEELAKTATDDAGKAIAPATLINMDFINGYDCRGTTPIKGIVTVANYTDAKAKDMRWEELVPEDITAIDLNNEQGIALKNGSYGKMGDVPMNNPEEMEKLLLDALGVVAEGKDYANSFDSIIYDLDAYKVDCIFDCNWPISVKRAIIDLVDFRGDMVFLSDLGTSLTSLDDIKTETENLTIDGKAGIDYYSNYTSLYHNYFKIVDPFSKKEITVTMPFMLVEKLTDHISKGVNRPFAGMANNLTFDNIIENSINFLPVEIPGVDQKQELIDINVNYLSLYDGVPVMETMYVNQTEFSQLSYLHNIMAVQEIIKLIRTRCPRTRYTFLDGDDLESYISDVQAIVKEYSSNFRNISCEYMADEKYEQNNTFYAVLKVQFKNFIQEEYFKIIAIS